MIKKNALSQLNKIHNRPYKTIILKFYQNMTQILLFSLKIRVNKLNLRMNLNLLKIIYMNNKFRNKNKFSQNMNHIIMSIWDRVEQEL